MSFFCVYVSAVSFLVNCFSVGSVMMEIPFPSIGLLGTHCLWVLLGCNGRKEMVKYVDNCGEISTSGEEVGRDVFFIFYKLKEELAVEDSKNNTQK